MHVNGGKWGQSKINTVLTQVWQTPEVPKQPAPIKQEMAVFYEENSHFAFKSLSLKGFNKE